MILNKSDAPNPLERLIRVLRKLPGIGERSASRLAFFILRGPGDLAHEMAEAILAVREKIHFCELCQNFTEVKRCSLCLSSERDHSLICLVEEPADLAAIEKAGTYRGLYHILHGAIAPMDGVGPEQLKIQELLNRVRSGGVKEVVLATNSNMEGEATALYIKDLLKGMSVRVTRLASGVPVGGDLEFTDPMTLARALESRHLYP
ncbi:MAG: recombination mediator RecR [Deltaproteobacteria bacterium]|nr:recombination mediator RecR [Deltaproteobacteria bacterium]